MIPVTIGCRGQLTESFAREAADAWRMGDGALSEGALPFDLRGLR
jgi:hypothetical protein